MREKLAKLPRLYLDNEKIMRYVDAHRDLIGYPSTLTGIDYVTDGQDLIIISRRGGYLRVNSNLLITIIDELKWMAEDIERRSRD